MIQNPEEEYENEENCEVDLFKDHDQEKQSSYEEQVDGQMSDVDLADL